MKQYILSALTLLCAVQILSAVPARPGKFTRVLPDGTRVTLELHGDEFCHWLTNESGQVVKEDARGFLVPSSLSAAGVWKAISQGLTTSQSNLKTLHYFGDSHLEVNKALIYSPGEDVNEGIYGRLYTWYSAVNIPEGSDVGVAPPLDADGFVRGICPAGWHIPATPESEALASHTTDELHSPDYWIIGAGTNSTGFTLLPAGYHNAALKRFEGMGTESLMWKTSSTSSTIYESSSICTKYFCKTVYLELTTNSADAYSVRCVKNY